MTARRREGTRRERAGTEWMVSEYVGANSVPVNNCLRSAPFILLFSWKR